MIGGRVKPCGPDRNIEPDVRNQASEAAVARAIPLFLHFFFLFPHLQGLDGIKR